MKTNSNIYRILFSLAAVSLSGSGQVILSGTGYVEGFDGIDSGLPSGWSVRTNASATSLGSPAVFNVSPTAWSSSSGQFANYASTVSNDGTNFAGSESSSIQSGCTNRCPAVRQTGSFGDPGAAYVLELQDTRGLVDFALSLDCNLLSAQGRSTVWSIDYGIGANPAEFTLLDSFVDPGGFGATVRTVSFGPALDDLDQPVWIRVGALDAATGTGSRDTFGIDNVRLSYRAGGTAAPVPLGIVSSGGNVVLNWTNEAFALQAAPSIDGTFTNVSGATSPYTNPVAGPQRYFRLKAN